MFKNIRIFVCLAITFSHVLYANELKQVTLQPTWFEQFQFAGYYIAKEKGFYNEAGLDVKINPFEFGNDTAQQVNDGKIDFAVGRESLIRESVHHKKLVILYALFQASPLVLLSTKESQIITVKNFAGKRIMATTGDLNEVSLKSMINSNAIKLTDLNILTHTHDITDLVNNKTDIISAYISKAPYELERMGVEYNLFAPADYGFDMYSDFLYTNEELMSKDIETVKAFKQASLKGWQYAFTHIDETVDLILDKYNQQKLTKAELLYEAGALKKLADAYPDAIGTIDNYKLKRILDLYKVLGVEKGNIDFTKLVYDEKNPRLILTAKEKAYLNQKDKITLCIDPDWLPYEGFDNQGKHIGFNTEIINIFRKQLSIPITVIQTSSWSQSLQFTKQKKCDLLSLAAKTPERMKYLSFTSPYLVFPRVLVTKPDITFIDNFTHLANRKIGIPKGYAQRDIIKESFPNIEIVTVDTTKKGLEKVTNGELYGFIGGLNTVSDLLQNRFMGQLKVSGKLDQKEEFGIAVRNDQILLLSIFEKLVQNLTEETKQDIISRSIPIKYEEEFNYDLLWKVVFILVLSMSAFLYRQSMLNKLNKTLNEKVKEKTKELQELNESLERKINERTRSIERSKQVLQNVAFKDNLTDIFNRHYLFKTSPSLLNSASEINQPLSLLLIDIDNFKKINDTHGHLIGDSILKFFVTNIQRRLRSDDIFVRYGGEEFVVLLPKVNSNESLIVAEKLRLAIELHPYREIAENITFTISIGVSKYRDGESLEKLINRADLALYKAKENGRNQVCRSETDTAQCVNNS